MIAIVESLADSASVHICEQLRELEEWEICEDNARPGADGGGTYYRTDGAILRQFEDLHLELDRPADAFDCDPEFLVFASRHAGETGPLLTGHFTGNLGQAEFGGEDHELADACPNALTRLLEAYDEYVPDGYDVSLECTHHGPSDVGCPSLFAELGSDAPQWEDPAGANAVARAILDLRGTSAHRDQQIVGFGGGHYVPRFERIVRETPWAVGHIASDWALDAMGSVSRHPDLIDRIFEASGTELAVIEHGDSELVDFVTDRGYRVVSETWLRTVEDRDPELIESVESQLGTVEDGVRFGTRRSGAFEIESLPRDLLDTAEGIDPDAVWATFESHCVAFETTNGASRVGERFAVPSATSMKALVSDLASILEPECEAVRLEEDTLIVEDVSFDPHLAIEAGVPEGPKFGTLASGESVTIDGNRVNPEDVSTRETRRYPL